MDTLLILNLAPELEEDLVDYLLELDCVSGFTSMQVHGHGRHGQMSIAEQVTGRRKRVQVELLLSASMVPLVLADLGTRVGRDITYWQQPVHGFGRIDMASQ